MSEQQEQDPRFGSELSYLGMLDDIARNNVEQNDRVESFGSNIWFPDISLSFPNFGNSEFNRADAKKDALYINEDCPEIQTFKREGLMDIRVNIEEINLVDEFPEAVCKYALAFENMCTKAGIKPGVIQFNLGIVWAAEEQVESIAEMLQAQITFPVHP